MGQEDYSYPDEGDSLVDTWIKRNEPYLGYWREDSNEFIFNFFLSELDSDCERVLDVGCGTGELFSFYVEKFDEVVALEPDQERLQEARRVAENEDWEHIQFRNEMLQEVGLQKSSFDAVICSHVIQHIPTGEIETFVSEIERVLRDNGVLALMAAYKRPFEPRFVKTVSSQQGTEDKAINQEEFNRLTSNEGNVLPTHNYSISEIEKLLDSFEIQEIKLYHDLLLPSIIDSIADRNCLINKRPVKGWLGRDIFVLAEK